MSEFPLNSEIRSTKPKPIWDNETLTVDQRNQRYAQIYGENSVAWEITKEGTKKASHLKLTPETRKALPIDWNSDPAKDLVMHTVSTWTKDDSSGRILLEKPDERYQDIVSGIRNSGHFSPPDYAQLTTSHIVGPWR